MTRTRRLLTVLVVLAGAFVFLWRLGVESSTGDELVYRDAGVAYVHGDFRANLEHPPLAKFLIGLGHLAFGGSLTADRLPSALMGLATGGVLFCVARRIGGPWAGLTAMLLWYFLPLHPGVVEAHVGRQATLEMPLLFFTACAVWAAQVVAAQPSWWRWAVFGAAVGAATATKLTGASVAVVVLAAWAAHPRKVGGALLAGVTAVVVFLATYLPFGAEAPDAVRTVVQWQLDHAGRGAVQHIAGQNHLFPPWWSAWWFQSRYLGWAALVALWTSALLGAALVRRVSTAVVATAVVGFTVAVVVSPLKLPQYHDVLAPPLVALAAVGLTRLVTSRAWPVAAVLALPLVVACAGQLGTVATTRTADYALLAPNLRDLPAGTTVVSWADTGTLQRAAPQVTVVGPGAVDCSAALVVDPTIANRIPGADLDGWLRQCGGTVERFDRLELVRPVNR
ncbi:ArnT family glycosyltransferase [Kineococcus sp. LSe6-4]|uniref:ArnT family glycosyltransferase n=1 Tax=Kineococcus halophytocola TaxID=3234027 RepID=A0ABV4H4R4_9ACTN